MARRQTTVFSWLRRRLGSSAANPIELSGDDTDTDNANSPPPKRASATDPIEISDNENEGDQAETNGVSAIEQVTNGGDTLPQQIAYHCPPRVPYWDHNRNPWDVRFTNLDLGACKCTRACSRHNCDNAKTAIYCDDTNCAVGQLCGNRLRDWPSLVLRPCIKGLGVMTTTDIPKGTVLGEYCGKIIPHSELTDEHTSGGFVLQFLSNCSTGEHAYIDARPAGSLCRFVNHSCAPSSMFDKFALRTTRKMVVRARTRIRAGDEITVKYDKELSFFCLCGEVACVSTRTYP